MMYLLFQKSAFEEDSQYSANGNPGSTSLDEEEEKKFLQVTETTFSQAVSNFIYYVHTKNYDLTYSLPFLEPTSDGRVWRRRNGDPDGISLVHRVHAEQSADLVPDQPLLLDVPRLLLALLHGFRRGSCFQGRSIGKTNI